MKGNKDWIKQTIQHKETGRVPFNFMFSPPIQDMLEKHYGTSDIEEELNFPIRITAPETIKPLYAHPEDYGETLTDEFGVTWTTSEIDRGVPIIPCLQGPDLEGYSFPDPSSEYRFKGIEKWCDRNRDNYTIIFVGDLWERAAFMRGLEKILLDVIEKPSFVEKLLMCLTDYIMETMRVLFDRCEFDGVAVSDDYGAQNGMLMSPETWRRFIKPCLKDIYSFARENGRGVMHHSCGNIRPVIPDLIDIGLDILHPIQPEAMDVFKLKKEFGRDLTFCGGLGTQELMPYGSPDQIRREIKTLKRELGKGGGYILEPGITVQADVPLENLLAMIDEAVFGN
jgi:uroporphyrinogen decarboxylase